MIDNYCSQGYHSWDHVYPHPETGNAIFLGDLASAQNLNFLHASRITTIITAALGMDQLDYSGLELRHIVYPLLDHKNQNISQFFEDFFALVEKNLRHGSILVHCHAGISRSSTLVISYLMRKKDWTFKQAIAHLRHSRPKVLPNLGFERQLKLYEGHLRQTQDHLPRKQYCHTSGDRRQLKSIQLEERPPLNVGTPVRSTPLVGPRPLKIHSQQRDNFQIRALKLRSLDSRARGGQKHLNSEGGQLVSALLSFEVLKVQISTRVPRASRLKPRLGLAE